MQFSLYFSMQSTVVRVGKPQEFMTILTSHNSFQADQIKSSNNGNSYICQSKQVKT